MLSISELIRIVILHNIPNEKKNYVFFIYNNNLQKAKCCNVIYMMSLTENMKNKLKYSDALRDTTVIMQKYNS
jgi:hypothetical protein